MEPIRHKVWGIKAETAKQIRRHIGYKHATEALIRHVEVQTTMPRVQNIRWAAKMVMLRV